MIHRETVEKWTQGAIDALKTLDENADYESMTSTSAMASACARIACAMSLARIADSLEKLVEQNQKSIV